MLLGRPQTEQWGQTQGRADPAAEVGMGVRVSGQGKGCGGREETARQWDDALPLIPLSLSLGQRDRTMLVLSLVLVFLDCSAPSTGSTPPPLSPPLPRPGLAIAVFPLPIEE